MHLITIIQYLIIILILGTAFNEMQKQQQLTIVTIEEVKIEPISEKNNCTI